MAISASHDRIQDWRPAAQPVTLRPVPEPAEAVPAGAALEAGATAPATHRRRSRWFELNPGCFGRVAVTAAAVAAAMATGGGILWTLRWVRQGRRVLRALGAVREARRQLRDGH